MAAIAMGTLTDLEKTSYVKKGLPFAKPKLIYSQDGKPDRVEKREGKTRQWFRMSKYAITSGSDFTGSATYVKNATGTPPTWTPGTPADTLVTAQVDTLFGKGHEWYEMADYTSFADLPDELRDVNFAHAAEAVETEVINVLKAGTTVNYANAKASRGLLDSNDKIDMYDIFAVGTTLRNNDTETIKGMYSVKCSANVIEQLMKDSVFQTAVANQKNYIFVGTIAELYGMRFDFSSLAPTVSNSGSNNAVATVEQTIILGANAFGISKWMLNDFDIIYTKPGGWGDEWAVRHGLTWKHYFKSVILNQSWMSRLESAR